MSTSSKLVRLALLALPVLASAAPAAANVRSVNSSTICQWEDAEPRRGFGTGEDGQGGTFIDNTFESKYSPENGMYHTAPGDDGATRYPVTCNIPRNLPLRTDGMSDLEVRFRSAEPRPGTRTVTCTAYSYRSDGTLASAATRSMTVSMASTETVPLDFGGSITASGSKGYYILTCNMPNDLALFSIYSSENDGVSGN